MYVHMYFYIQANALGIFPEITAKTKSFLSEKPFKF